jgi:RND family efflux transporter MFP subunit
MPVSAFLGRRLLCLVFLFAAFATAACNRTAPGQQAATEEAAPIRVGPENVVHVRQEIIHSGPRLSGSLEPREQARIRAEVPGAVTHVGAELGQRVKKGQILARIEDIALQNAYASAQSALQSAKITLENANRQAGRAERLYATGALSQADLETAQSQKTAADAQVAQAQALLTQARKQLQAATVESPMDGVISEKEVSQGDIVAMGSPLVTVIDPSSMRLEAAIPSEELAALKVGTRVDFEVRGFPGQTFRGTIEHVAPAVDPETRQITTLVDIPNPGGKLLAGLFAEGRIGATRKETLVVPIAAIDTVEHPPSVLRITNGKVERVTVKLGLQDPQTERVEIQGPIREGDRLLSGAAKEIAPGTKVTFTGPGHAANR